MGILYNGLLCKRLLPLHRRSPTRAAHPLKPVPPALGLFSQEGQEAVPLGGLAKNRAMAMFPPVPPAGTCLRMCRVLAPAEGALKRVAPSPDSGKDTIFPQETRVPRPPSVPTLGRDPSDLLDRQDSTAPSLCPGVRLPSARGQAFPPGSVA